MKLAVIGAGTISADHIKGARAAGWEVAALCDRNPERLSAQAAEFGIEKTYLDSADLFADPTIDAVSIATPVKSHTPIVLAALAAGKHVFCEKPPAMTAAEVASCIEARDRAGKILQYGFLRHFKPEDVALRERYLRGDFGKIVYAEAQRLDRCINPGGWFNDRRFTKGGSLFDAAIHEIDELLYILDYPDIEAVQAFLSYENRDLHEKLAMTGKGYASSTTGQFNNDVETAGTVFVRCAGGIPLVLRSSSASCVPENTCRIELVGSRAGYRFNHYTDSISVDLNESGFEEKTVERTEFDYFKAEFAHLADCIEGKAKSIASPEMAYKLMKLYDAIYQSDEEKRPITLK